MSNLLPLDHLPCHLHQLMRGPQCPLAHLAEHLREFEQARLAVESFDARERAVALDQFLHLVMLVAEDSQLRKMRHAEHLM